MTIDDLAVMVSQGFEHVGEEIGGIKQEIGGIKQEIGGIKQEIGGMKQEIGGIKQDIGELKHQMQALNSNVNNYLELSERRYVELKQRDALLAKWLKIIADKTDTPIDVSQLEKI